MGYGDDSFGEQAEFMVRTPVADVSSQLSFDDYVLPRADTILDSLYTTPD